MISKFEWIEPSLLRAFNAEGTTAHRLCTADDGAVELFDRDVLISYRNNAVNEQFVRDLHVWAKTAGFEFHRIFSRLLPRGEEERKPPRLLSGDPEIELETIVTEQNLRFRIDFGAGYSPGLFLDQRENRAYVRKAAPRRLLNCFAYTCSFSVAAGSAGAVTLNVDLSKKSLNRGRENFSLNLLPTTTHRFITDDVRPVLKRLARRSEKFDMIVLDPPTFSRARHGRAFRVENDFPDVILASLPLLESQGRMLLSTNCADLPESALRKMAGQCLRQLRLEAEFYRQPRPPDFPDGSGAATLWLTLR